MRSYLDIDPAQLEAYKAAVTEEIEASIRLEPGVLAIYSVALKDNPGHLRFLEFYANEQAYLMHRESPHFKKYLAVTKPMIKALRLFEAEPIRLGLKAATQASVEITQPHVERRRLSPDDVQQVAPAFERYTQEKLYGEVWIRSGLSPRDRSIVTISVLIAHGQVGALPYYFAQALDNGVKQSEISEIIVHLAYYSGWGNAFGAIGPAKEVFAQRGIGQDQLPGADVELLPLNEEAEAQRASTVEANYGAVAPGVVQYTTDALFIDLWRRPDLAPRDRSLVTVSALIANGHTAPVSYHLNRAMDNGLTQEQASEALTQLAFYAGWPNVFGVLPVVKDVLEARSKPTH